MAGAAQGLRVLHSCTPAVCGTPYDPSKAAARLLSALLQTHLGGEAAVLGPRMSPKCWLPWLLPPAICKLGWLMLQQRTDAGVSRQAASGFGSAAGEPSGSGPAAGQPLLLLNLLSQHASPPTGTHTKQ